METIFVPIDKIELDINNPRIARILEMRTDIKAEDIALALGAGDSQEGETYTTFYSLKESIRRNQGIIHPVIINRIGKKKMVVIEGNTRVQIYRDFAEEKVLGDWKKILAIVYDDLDAVKIDGIRLQSHLVGPRPWDPYSKAKYLNHLRNSEHMTFDQLVDFCGGRKKQVVEYINAYNDMEKFYRPALKSPGEEFDETRFSAFVELQKPNITQALVVNNYSKTDFSRWIIEQLIAPLQTVRQLPRILANEKARETFLQDGAQAALIKLDTPPANTDLAQVSLTDLAREITRRLAKLEFREVQKMKGNAQDACREALLDSKLQLDELLPMIGEGENA